MANLKQEYQKARKRMLQRVRSAKKAGYEIPKSLIPKIPKRITQGSIERLNKIRAKQLRKKKYRTDYQKKNKPEEKTPEYIPSFSTVNELRNRIRNIQRQKYPDVPIDTRKNILLNLLEQGVLEFGEEEYSKYLSDKMEEIQDGLQIIEYDSKQEKIEATFVNVATLLKMDKLSELEREDISILAEYE